MGAFRAKSTGNKPSCNTKICFYQISQITVNMLGVSILVFANLGFMDQAYYMQNLMFYRTVQ